MTDLPHLPAPIRIAQLQDGTLLYLCTQAPGTLPPVRARDLELAWDRAHAHAAEGRWGTSRRFRFATAAGTTDIALTDPDATSWADAVDAMAGLQTHHGMSLCLRLLALVDVLARSPAGTDLLVVRDGQAELDAALLRWAATTAMDDAARFAGLPTSLAAPAAPCELLAPTKD